MSFGLYNYSGGGGGGGGTVTSSGMTANKIPRATAAQNIEDSKLVTDVADNFLMWQGTQMVINNTTIETTAVFEVDSSTKGLLIPRMTNAQRLAIAVPAQGLMVYENDAAPGIWYWESGAWRRVSILSGNVTSIVGLTPGKIPVATSATNIESSALGVSGNDWSFNTFSNVAMQQLQGLGGVPAIAVGANATAATIAGTDLAGNFTVTYAAVLAANGLIATITFNQPFAVAPKSIIVGVAGGAIGPAGTQVHADLASITTIKFEVRNSAIAGLATLTTDFFYIIVQ